MPRSCLDLSVLHLSGFGTARATFVFGMLGGCSFSHEVVFGERFSFEGAGPSGPASCLRSTGYAATRRAASLRPSTRLCAWLKLTRRCFLVGRRSRTWRLLRSMRCAAYGWQEGISTGFPGGTFCPFDVVERCDTVAFLRRMVSLA